MLDWLQRIVNGVAAELSLEKIVIGVTASVLVYLIVKFLRRLYRYVVLVIWPNGKAQARIDAALAAVAADSPGVWLSNRPAKPKDGYAQRLSRSGVRIITVANLKGGVGKTTVAANLAAHYAIANPNERVMLIDLDFQGSLSATMLEPGRRRPKLPADFSKASQLIGDKNRTTIDGCAERVHLPLNPAAHLDGVPAFYDLARTENRILVEWLLGCYDTDMRYWLAEILLASSYDKIIIDAPPRLLSGCVQALCASHFVLVPTILDQVCVEAVDAFLGQLYDHREIWPIMKVAGVIPTITSANFDRIAERDALAELRDVIAKSALRTQLLPQAAFVRDNKLLSEAAGQRIAYASERADQAHRDLRANFAALADAIERSIRGDRFDE
ncbi:MAG: ParA family protein [Hyphomicrobiales bacterium]|nr:ParA family protein [Hyphomicrobiales bacterium]